MKTISLYLLKFYRVFLSVFFGGSCRFYPSCSVYAEEAFQKHTPYRAFLLTLKRILKCHPLGSSGLDLVPEKKDVICKKTKTF